MILRWWVLLQFRGSKLQLEILKSEIHTASLRCMQSFQHSPKHVPREERSAGHMRCRLAPSCNNARSSTIILNARLLIEAQPCDNWQSLQRYLCNCHHLLRDFVYKIELRRDERAGHRSVNCAEVTKRLYFPEASHSILSQVIISRRHAFVLVVQGQYFVIVNLRRSTCGWCCRSVWSWRRRVSSHTSFKPLPVRKEAL